MSAAKKGSTPIRDSGQRDQFKTGAVRDVTEGKGAFHLLTYAALRRLAVHYESGALKYDADNWIRGIPLSRFVDSAFRHLLAFLVGLRDEDHEAAFTWNAIGLMETKARIDAGLLPKELDDLRPALDPEKAWLMRQMVEKVFEPVEPVEPKVSK